MRKLILIIAVSLLATQANAGGSRSLSLATSQQATEQPATGAPQAAPTQAPATATAAVTPTVTTTPTTAAPATTAPVVASTTGTARPKHRQPSTEARVIRELHRHGIYW